MTEAWSQLWKLRQDGYRDPGEPKYEFFETQSAAQDRARYRKLSQYTIYRRVAGQLEDMAGELAQYLNETSLHLVTLEC